MPTVCDMNCFACPHEDCIFDDLTYQDYQSEKEIDLLSGAKVLKTSPSMLASRKQYREENKEKIAASRKQYYEENKEKIAAYGKQYREENKEKIAAYGKQYREENKEAIRAEQKSYYQRNKDKWKTYAQNRKEKLANGGNQSRD